MPKVEAGIALIQVQDSCVSIGTELSGPKASGESLWKRATPYSAKVKKVIEMVSERGPAHTIGNAQGALMSGQLTYYSACGVVLTVGSDVQISDQTKFWNGLHNDQ
jgi:hypothetical protein